MALVVTTALATAFIFTALWYALGMRPLHLVSGPEFYNTNRPTDRRSHQYDRQLRRSHAFEPAPQPVPQLGPVTSGDRCSSKAGPRLLLIPTPSAGAASESRRPPRSCCSPSRQNRRPRLDPPRTVPTKTADPCRRRNPDRRYQPVMILQSRMANRRSWPLSMRGSTRRSTRRSASNGLATLISSSRVP